MGERKRKKETKGVHSPSSHTTRVNKGEIQDTETCTKNTSNYVKKKSKKEARTEKTKEVRVTNKEHLRNLQKGTVSLTAAGIIASALFLSLGRDSGKGRGSQRTKKARNKRKAKRKEKETNYIESKSVEELEEIWRQEEQRQGEITARRRKIEKGKYRKDKKLGMKTAQKGRAVVRKSEKEAIKDRNHMRTLWEGKILQGVEKRKYRKEEKLRAKTAQKRRNVKSENKAIKEGNRIRALWEEKILREAESKQEKEIRQRAQEADARLAILTLGIMRIGATQQNAIRNKTGKKTNKQCI